jgi:hypothetical protein
MLDQFPDRVETPKQKEEVMEADRPRHWFLTGEGDRRQLALGQGDIDMDQFIDPFPVADDITYLVVRGDHFFDDFLAILAEMQEVQDVDEGPPPLVDAPITPRRRAPC